MQKFTVRVAADVIDAETQLQIRFSIPAVLINNLAMKLRPSTMEANRKPGPAADVEPEKFQTAGGISPAADFLRTQIPRRFFRRSNVPG